MKSIVRASNLVTGRAAVSNLFDHVADLECCYPKCYAPSTSLVNESLCDNHLMHIYRVVVALGKQKNPPAEALAANVMWRKKYATMGEVYFMRFGDRIKIGFSTSLRTRLRVIPHDELLATTPGSRYTEGQTHKRFAHLRLTGEWFSMGEDLMDYIATLKPAV